MSVSVSNAQSILQDCVIKAVREGETLMAQLLAQASQSLNDQAQSSTQSPQERQQAADALRLLQRQEPALLRAYPLALLECFAQDRNAGNDLPSPPKVSDIDFGSLSLIDEKEHDAQVERVRAQQQVAHVAEVVLSELNALVSAAQGLHRVQAERNPLRPENYIRALQKVLHEQVEVPSSVRATWIQHLLPALGAALISGYQQAVQVLRQQGIEPVGYGVVSSRYPHLSAHHSGAAVMTHSQYGAAFPSGQAHLHTDGPQATATEAQAQEDALTASILHQLLQGGADPYSGLQGGWEQAPLASNDYALMSAPDVALQAADVVARMMDNIAQDPRLLPTVRKTLQGMEPAIGQLAGYDSGFFSNPLHPARRLLDQITERSLTFTTENQPGFSRFIGLLHQVNQHLSQQDTRQAAPFATALQHLETVWAQWQQQEQQQRQAVAQVAEQANHHQHLTSEIASNIRKLPDTSHVPAEVMNFATGLWTQVIAQAQLEQPDSQDGDPHGYLALIPLLFWSVRPNMLPDERQQIAQAVPEMISTLQKGLQAIGRPQTETERFIAKLQRLHQQTLAVTRAPASAPVVTTSPTPAANTQHHHQPLSKPDIDLNAGPNIDIELDSVYGTPAELTHATAPATMPVLAHDDFPTGTWVELHSNRHVVRTQLTWASPKGTLFLFTAADGSTQSMTRRMRDRLLTEGAMRVLTAGQ